MTAITVYCNDDYSAHHVLEVADETDCFVRVRENSPPPSIYELSAEIHNGLKSEFDHFRFAHDYHAKVTTAIGIQYGELMCAAAAAKRKDEYNSYFGEILTGARLLGRRDIDQLLIQHYDYYIK